MPLILSGGGLLGGIAALLTAVFSRKNTKEDIDVKHGANVLSGYSELLEILQRQVEALGTKSEQMSVTIERQGEEITALKIELRDRDDKIRLLTLDRDDLVSLAGGASLPLPTLRTV